MTHNIGEEIAGAYLKEIKNCDFVDYNIYTKDVQGEIDVIGVDTIGKKVYICEVAIHLATGLQYTNPKTKRPDNTERLIKKFEKDFDYAKKRFDKRYKKIFMLWSPIVKDQKIGTMYNQLESVVKVKEHLKNKHSIDLELMINEKFQECLNNLRSYSEKKSEELKTPILRLMQIEEKLKKHLIRNNKKIIKGNLPI